MTPAAFRYSISGWETLMKQRLWIKTTGIIPCSRTLTISALSGSPCALTVTGRKGSPPKAKSASLSPRTPALHGCIPASDTHPEIQSEIQLCLFTQHTPAPSAAPLRFQVFHSPAGNKCQQQLSLCFGGWSDNLCDFPTSSTSSCLAFIAPLSQQISQKENKVWTDLFAKLSIHNLFHAPNPCSENNLHKWEWNICKNMNQCKTPLILDVQLTLN